MSNTTGRQETDRKYQELAFKRLAKLPKYFESFYYYMNDSTEVCKYQTISYAGRFVQYCEESLDYDISKPKFLNKITETEIRKYMDLELGKLSTASLGNHVNALKRFFKYAYAERLISQNPLRDMVKPKDKSYHPVTVMEADEVRMMLQNIKDKSSFPERDICMVSLMLELGLRRGSVSELNVDDIDFENERIHLITKGNYERYLPFGKNMKSHLKKWMKARNAMLKDKSTDALFLNSNGDRITGASINTIVKKYVDSDKPITAHKLRATCATNLYEATDDIYLVAAMLGHANPVTTSRYAKVKTDRLKTAANLLDPTI